MKHFLERAIIIAAGTRETRETGEAEAIFRTMSLHCRRKKPRAFGVTGVSVCLLSNIPDMTEVRRECNVRDRRYNR